MKNILYIFTLFLLMLLTIPQFALALDETKITTSLGVSGTFWEGEEENDHSIGVEGKLGYDLNEFFTLEGSLNYQPYYDNEYTRPDPSVTNVARLGNTNYSIGAAADLLFHLNGFSNDGKAFINNVDPFLAVTGGAKYLNDSLYEDNINLYAGAGAGVAVYLNDNWYARADYRFIPRINIQDHHDGVLSVGYRWGSSNGSSNSSNAGDTNTGTAIDNTKIDALKTIYFDFDSAELTDVAQETLKENSVWLLAHPEAGIVLEGHCDERGTNEYNLALGSRRAKSAFDFLVALGVPATQLKVVTYGEEVPAVVESNEAAWSLNRRVACTGNPKSE